MREPRLRSELRQEAALLPHVTVYGQSRSLCHSSNPDVHSNGGGGCTPATRAVAGQRSSSRCLALLLQPFQVRAVRVLEVTVPRAASGAHKAPETADHFGHKGVDLPRVRHGP